MMVIHKTDWSDLRQSEKKNPENLQTTSHMRFCNNACANPRHQIDAPQILSNNLEYRHGPPARRRSTSQTTRSLVCKSATEWPRGRPVRSNFGSNPSASTCPAMACSTKTHQPEYQHADRRRFRRGTEYLVDRRKGECCAR